MDSTGKETVLHSFVGGKDGANPWSGLIMDAAGNLYGTTLTGGGAGTGYGVVFKLAHGTQGWKETILYAFKGGSYGAHPGYGALARDTAGNLYGTTIYGGTGYCSTGCGVVFRLTHTSGVWKEKVLHTFTETSQTDGATPYGGVVLDADGNVYGTTSIGGNTTCGCGTVFKLDPSGTETILYNFAGGTDGAEPYATLVRDAAGNLYGTTLFGGNNLGFGTVFKLDPSGAKTLLHTFAGYPSDGSDPYSPLVRDPAANLYGTTYFGGNSSGGGFCETNHQPQGCGIVFMVNPSGKETILHNFSYYVDGAGAGGPKQIHAGIVFKLSK